MRKNYRTPNMKTRQRLKNNQDLRLKIDSKMDFGSFTLKQLNDYAQAIDTRKNWEEMYLQQIDELHLIQITLPIILQSAPGLTLSWWEN